MQNRPIWILTLALLASLALTTYGQPAEEVALLAMDDQGVTLSFSPGDGTGTPLTVELHELDGKVLATQSFESDVPTVSARLSAKIDPEKPADYYVSYRYGQAEPTRKSLFFLSPALETIVLAQREYLGGSRPVVQVLVRNRSTERPVANAKVTVSVTDGDETLTTRNVDTDHRGAASVALDLPDRDIPSAQLLVTAASATAKDTVTESIRIRRGTRTLLTTDKPLYQPGQTIHLRALSLSRPSMKPLAATEVTFEVQDAKGNKVFKKKVTTDAYGVSHADFVLAHELNQGAYRISHIAGPVTEEKTVTVQPYVLPKFKVAFKSDRAFYQPGETIKAEVQTDYFFGKPVAGAEVHVSCAKFDAVYTTFQEVKGKTDENGHYSFEVKLPDHFVGQPFEQGKGSAKLEITVIDTADHREQVTRNVSVTENPIIMAAIPESGTLVPGLENRVYIVTTYADAKPASCLVTWRNGPDGAPATVQTDEAGFGEVILTPKAGEQVVLHLDGADAAGLQGHAERTLETRAMATDDRVLLRTDRALYKVGDSVNLEVRSSRRSGTAYLDVIKDGQTQLTRTLDLVDGKGSLGMTLDPALAGTVQFSAYVIGGNGVVVRDRRVVLVDPANDLAIEVLPGQDTYLPGEDAKIEIRVTNPAGNGVTSALGVTIVDEAVFALQDMQPGMEKVYFYLEREIAKPRYEIHGVEIDGVMPCLDVPGPLMQREQAAKVLLASAAGTGDYPIQVNTYERDQKGSAFEARMQGALAKDYQRITTALNKYCQKHKDALKEKATEPVTLDDLVRDGFLRKNEARDPWGQVMRISGQRCESCVAYHELVLSSAGIDGRWDTADDVTYSQQALMKRMRRNGLVMRGIGGGVGGFEMEEGMDFMVADMAMPMAMASSVGGVGAQAEPPRIRQYFPETLYFNPAVITDGNGVARLTVPMADSITTWRMSCMASSSGGALGSTDAGLRVFQDFFVDVDFPVALTQNDEVSVPVVVYNYLKTDQAVRLVAEKADWFELKGEAEQTLNLGPSEVKAVYFPITAKGIGNQKFTVFAYGSDKSDAVARSVEVRPDGKEYLVAFSGRLEGNVTHTVTIPEDAIANASKVFVKVYPGVLSQVVEGLDSMLRMPSGCFEQTSSATYPNILVMDYMKTTGQISPELQMKAEGFINAGYQRLVSFEVDGGGFEWFGKAPAHRILTAYGLMEFYDMSKVHDVDPAIISRTQRWLAAGQEKDGSFKPSEGGIAEGAINAYRDNVLRSTAYIAWALAYSGHQGPEVEKALRYVREHKSDLKDNFTLALSANALATVAPKDEATIELLNLLMERRTEEDDAVHWKAESETPTHGRGESANIEVTGLAVQAFITAGRELGTVTKAVTWLARNKDAYGTWQSTQATIQALRAMLMAERGATPSGASSIDVVMNGDNVTTLNVDESNSDVLQLVDMKELTRDGDNVVVLAVKGEGGLLYQVVGRYYRPHQADQRVEAGDPMSISVDYDRTALATDDILGVTAKVEYLRAGRAKMVMVDLGLPPGFTLVPDRLEKAVAAGTIEKYTATGRQLIIYLDALESGKPVSIEYQLQAKYPLRAKTGKASVYEYYDPTSRAEAAPVELSVTDP